MAKLATFKLPELYKKNRRYNIFQILTQEFNNFSGVKKLFVENYYFDRRKLTESKNDTHNEHNYSVFIKNRNKKCDF